MKLFADDSLLYGLVHNSDDAISLQSDLDKLVEPRMLRYNLRNSDHNLTLPSYNN